MTDPTPHAAADPNSTSTAAAPPSGPLTTRLNKVWLAKTGLVLVISVTALVWGFIDATLVYPRRGYEDASFKQRLYLKQAQQAVKLDSASIPDPAARRGTLLARKEQLEKAVTEATRLQAATGPDAVRAEAELRRLAPELVDAAALVWLDSLALVGRLQREHTEMKDPAAELKALDAKWSGKEQPLALAFYDLPSQWIITAAGGIGTIYVTFWMLLPALRAKYTWEPSEQRLTLRGGRSVQPQDVAEFDKRRWDKFYVTLHLKPESQAAKAGARITLDLYPHVPLEDWILEMERTAFPELAKEGVAAEAGNSTAPNPNT